MSGGVAERDLDLLGGSPRIPPVRAGQSTDATAGQRQQGERQDAARLHFAVLRCVSLMSRLLRPSLLRTSLSFLMLAQSIGTFAPAEKESTRPAPWQTLGELHRELDQLLMLHCDLPEPPTVVLAGHRNNGKSALIEAIMGVRLTEVGAGSGTRRILRVHSQYDASAVEPALFLEVITSKAAARARACHSLTRAWAIHTAPDHPRPPQTSHPLPSHPSALLLSINLKACVTVGSWS